METLGKNWPYHRDGDRLRVVPDIKKPAVRRAYPNFAAKSRKTRAIQKIGWGARIRTWECRYQKPVPYRLATPQCGPDHSDNAPPPQLAIAKRKNGLETDDGAHEATYSPTSSRHCEPLSLPT